MRKYSDIKVGEKETLEHTITKSDLEKFVALTGDDNKLHVDESYALKTPFKKPVVHGMLGASFISTIIGTRLPGDGALWFAQSLEFLLPVRIGDRLSIEAEVIRKIDREQVLEIRTDIYNQHRQNVTKGISKVKVIEQTEEPESPEGPVFTKTALVIGGTGAIGRATCLQLAKDGFNLIIHYNKNEARAREIKAEAEQFTKSAVILQADILNEKETEALIQSGIRKFGRIDVLVNCAASHIPAIKFQKLLWSDYLSQLELNIKSTMGLIQAALAGMQEHNYGKIILVGSMAADRPNADWSHYITAKSALVGLTKSLAYELAAKGIRINMVTPGLIDSELTADIPEKIKLITAAQTPLKRLTTAKDVAGTISFLASANADFITGDNIRVTGGQVMI